MNVTCCWTQTQFFFFYNVLVPNDIVGVCFQTLLCFVLFSNAESSRTKYMQILAKNHCTNSFSVKGFTSLIKVTCLWPHKLYKVLMKSHWFSGTTLYLNILVYQQNLVPSWIPPSWLQLKQDVLDVWLDWGQVSSGCLEEGFRLCMFLFQIIYFFEKEVAPPVTKLANQPILHRH